MRTIGILIVASLAACITPGGLGGGDCGVMAAGDSLGTEDALTSCDGNYQLVMQADGNLVLYDGIRQPQYATWATGTNGWDGRRANMQSDGNFVLYDSYGTQPSNALWASNTWGNDGAQLELSDSGALRVTLGSHTLWSYIYGDRDAGGY